MTPEEKRLALHIFNSRGKSILTADHQEARILELEKENADLKRKLAAVVKRLRERAEKRPQA